MGSARKVMIVKGMDSTIVDVEETDYYGKEFIGIVQRIRGYALHRSLKICRDEHEGNDGFNVHLFKWLEACGMDLEEFVRSYLSVIQPYSLSFYQKSKTSSGHIWLEDVGYGFKLVIKINEVNKDKPILISFHESNFNGVFRAGEVSFMDKPCAVLVQSASGQSGRCYVEYLIQRGFIRKLYSGFVDNYAAGVALIDYNLVKLDLDNILKSIFTRLYTEYFQTMPGSDKFLNEVSTSNLSFVSNGFTTLNNLGMLIDLHSKARSENEKAIITELARNIVNNIPDYLLMDMREVLFGKYGKRYTNDLYLAIISDMTR